jgi:hypothetical protein
MVTIDGRDLFGGSDGDACGPEASLDELADQVLNPTPVLRRHAGRQHSMVLTSNRSRP